MKTPQSIALAAGGMWAMLRLDDTMAATSLGLQHALERSGHEDMIEHLRKYYAPYEQEAFCRGLLVGWFLRTQPVPAPRQMELPL